MVHNQKNARFKVVRLKRFASAIVVLLRGLVNFYNVNFGRFPLNSTKDSSHAPHSKFADICEISIAGFASWRETSYHPEIGLELGAGYSILIGKENE